MRLAIFSAIACVITAVVAQGSSSQNPPIVNGPFMVTAGKPATLTWKPTTPGPVTLTLREGASSDLKTVTVIASSIDNSGSYTFTLPSDTTRNSDYTVEISDDKTKDTNYTPQFVVESTNTVVSMSSSASASATSATSASSASSASTASTASTASAKSASSQSSTMTRSTTSNSRSSSTSSATGATTAAPAPSNGANALGVQGGLVAMMIAAVAVY